MNTTSNAQIIRCSSCNTNNRVDLKRPDGRSAVCGKCKTPLTDDLSPLIITDANFAEVVERTAMPVLIDFWAAWCGPCRMVAPIVEQVAKEMAGQALIGKLDVDANPVTAGRFRVQSIPSLLIFKNGREVDRIVGVQSREVILQRLRRHL
jgi:thioredoxin 2